MKMQKWLALALAVSFCMPGLASASEEDAYAAYQPQKDAALTYLTNALHYGDGSVYVYSDFALTENHFTQKAKMWGNDETLVADMDENWSKKPFQGSSCIRCEIEVSRRDWGGWLFLNGYLPEGEKLPHLNDGSTDGEGLDLTGATELRFWARGEKGGEKVEFFTGGFGYDGNTNDQTADYPDSTHKQSLGYMKLTKQWAEYSIPLTNVDMSYIVCGFGFVCSTDNSKQGKNVFYLDEIRFVGDFTAAEDAPVMIRSYDTDNVYIQNAAFSYDNALVALAFLSAGNMAEAGALLDAFCFAIDNDREIVYRVRNAYAAGDISPFPGWAYSARLPGWYDTEMGKNGTWLEDRYQVGSNVGNTSYVALALLQYDAQIPNASYVNTACSIMDWVLENCTDATDGFTGGFDGWAEADPPVMYPLTYKSIEHNIDAYAVFRRLYALTGKNRYRDAAESALQFIQSMYNDEEGVFYTGTTDDGHTPNMENIVLDAQVWAALALGEAFTPYEKVLERVKTMRVQKGGYPFCQANANGGWWAEGTAYTALMYRLRGDTQRATQALDELCKIQLKSGVFPAATVNNLSTGFDLFTGEPWVYSKDAHIAPTAWFVMAVNGFNPYAF